MKLYFSYVVTHSGNGQGNTEPKHLFHEMDKMFAHLIKWAISWIGCNLYNPKYLGATSFQ